MSDVKINSVILAANEQMNININGFIACF